MAEYLIQDTTLTGIADAIRSKTGSTDAIKVSDMAGQIEGITTGGGAAGAPFIMQKWITKNAYQSAGTAVTLSLSIPHGCKIMDAYATCGATFSGSYYPQITSFNRVALHRLVITENDSGYNNSNDTVSYTQTVASGVTTSYYTTYSFILLYTTDVMTVASGENGVLVGTLNRSDALGTDSVFYGHGLMNMNAVMQIEKLNIAEGVTEVPGYLCKNQKSLSDGDLSLATDIGDYAFYGCSALTSVDLSNAISIGNYAFCGSALTSIQLNPNLTTLGNYAFSECSKLTGTLEIPAAITTIPTYAFYLHQFDNVVFPAGLTAIYSSAFRNSKATEYDFSACTSIPSLYDSDAFGTVGNGQVLKIPSALFDTWKTASRWSTWADQMVAV